MNPNDANVSLLERAAEQLGAALLEQLVFVGGALVGVLITDPAMPEIRPTQDVDVICNVVAQKSKSKAVRHCGSKGPSSTPMLRRKNTAGWQRPQWDRKLSIPMDGGRLGLRCFSPLAALNCSLSPITISHSGWAFKAATARARAPGM